MWEEIPRPIHTGYLGRMGLERQQGAEGDLAKTVRNSGPCNSLLVFHWCPHHHLSAPSVQSSFPPQNETETPHPGVQSCQELVWSASLFPFTRTECGQLLLLTHPPCLQHPQPSLSLTPEILFVLQNLAEGLKLLWLF